MVALSFYLMLFVKLCESKRSLVPQAILEVVKNRYGQSGERIEVFYNSERLKVLDETIKLLSEVKEIKLKKVDSTTKLMFGETCYTDAIFLFDRPKRFLELEMKLETSCIGKAKKDTESNALVYYERFTKSKFLEHLPTTKYISILLEDNETISLNTIARYTEKRCGVPQLTEINRFSLTERKWSGDKFFVSRIKNFYACELRFGIKDNFVPFVNYEVAQDRKSFTVDGVLIEMFKVLSTQLNFTISFNPVYEEEFQVPKVDWILGVQTHHSNLKSDYTVGDTIYTTSDVFVVPPGEFYTSWEKLFLPFDEATWSLLGIVFIAALVGIFFTRYSMSLRDFVVGSNVTTPAFNLFGIFMGIGQLFLPQRNISRFMFMCFVLFCLVIRTAYQGKYFEFLTSDMRRKPISSVQELVDKNFTFYIEEREFLNKQLSYYEKFDNGKNIRLIKDENNKRGAYHVTYDYRNFTLDSLADILNQTQNSSFKGAMLHKDISLALYNYRKPLKERLSFITINEKIFNHRLTLFLQETDNYLTPTFKWKMLQLIEGGFFNHWIGSFLSHRSVNEREAQEDKIVLTMEHLNVGFTIWISLLMISLVALTAELVFKHTSNHLRSILFKFMFKKFQKLGRNQ